MAAAATFSTTSPSSPTNETAASAPTSAVPPQSARPQRSVTFDLLTAYTDDDYRVVGDLCASVNAAYAARHGYHFSAVVRPKREMLDVVGSRGHPTWFKVWLFLQWLQDVSTALPSPSEQRRGEQRYLVWLDADAAVVDFPSTLEKIVTEANFRDLIIAEDMHTGNLVNCGVIFIKSSLFSRTLWESVWNLKRTHRATKERRYFDRPFYEQTALQKVLKGLGEFADFFVGDVDVEKWGGWHSFVAAAGVCEGEGEQRRPDDLKLFAHTCVYPMHRLNSNITDESLSLLEGGRQPKGTSFRANGARKNRHRRTEFIFHAAGSTSSKLALIQGMLRSRGLGSFVVSGAAGKMKMCPGTTEEGDQNSDGGRDAEKAPGDGVVDIHFQTRQTGWDSSVDPGKSPAAKTHAELRRGAQEDTARTEDTESTRSSDSDEHAEGEILSCVAASRS
eukprot:g14718.t1